MKKGNCPACNVGPRKIEIWNTIAGTGKRCVWLKCSACLHRFEVQKPVKKIRPEHAEAIAIIKAHNAWRRGDNSPPTDPEKLGQAIDFIVRDYESKK
jgi:hypothetical protein